MNTLYQDCIKLGLKIDSHESDLYIEDTPQARELLAKHAKRGKRTYTVDGFNVAKFYSQIDGKPWLDVPFAYDPFWESKGFPAVTPESPQL